MDTQLTRTLAGIIVPIALVMTPSIGNACEGEGNYFIDNDGNCVNLDSWSRPSTPTQTAPSSQTGPSNNRSNATEPEVVNPHSGEVVFKYPIGSIGQPKRFISASIINETPVAVSGIVVTYNVYERRTRQVDGRQEPYYVRVDSTERQVGNLEPGRTRGVSIQESGYFVMPTRMSWRQAGRSRSISL